MASRESAFIDITPEVLLKAYSCGIFPMAESADDPSLFWVEPEVRGVIPLDAFRIASRKRDLGQINQAEFIDSRRAMTDAQLNLNVTRFAALGSLAELEYALGADSHHVPPEGQP